jgi:hypothetical protein
MRRVVAAAVIAVIAALVGSACGPAFPNAPSTSASSSSPTATAADLAFCVADINGYRAQANRPPLAESMALETFAAAGAQTDAASGVPHAHFTASNGAGIATAENEFLTADRQLFPTTQDAMHGASALFWAEGPTGSHYQTLVGPYSQVGCGVFVANGAVTVVQDYR